MKSLMKPHHHRKRDFVEKQALHIVLKSTCWVFKNSRVRQITDSCLIKVAGYFKIKLYHRAIVGNHLHLVLLSPSKDALSGFLRVTSGQLAVTLRKRGLFSEAPLWEERPWSRVLTWGRNYGTAIKYLALNYLEGIGKIIRTHERGEIKKHAVWIEAVLAKKLTVPIPS